MLSNAGVRKAPHITNARAIEVAGDAVSASVKNVGKDKLAKSADVTTRTIEKWMAHGSLPSVDCLLNMSAEDPAILRAVVALGGWNLTPQSANPANDMELAAGLGHGLSELIDRLRDGRRCHIDTVVLAELFRQLIPQMQAIVDEADALRGAA